MQNYKANLASNNFVIGTRFLKLCHKIHSLIKNQSALRLLVFSVWFKMIWLGAVLHLPNFLSSVEQVVAQYSYTAQHADELSFEKNAIINVINKDDPDWWKGELNGQEGMFPANYVTPLTQNVDAAASSTLTSCKL